MGQSTPARRAFALLAAPIGAALLLPGQAAAAPPPLQVKYDKIDCASGEVLVSITNPGPDAHEFTLYRDDDVIARGRSAANETVEESVRITRSARLKVHGDGEQVSERWIDACLPATTRTAGRQREDQQGSEEVHHGLFDFGKWGQDREDRQSEGGDRQQGLFDSGKWGQDREDRQSDGGDRQQGLFDFSKWGQDHHDHQGDRGHGLFDFDKWGQGREDHQGDRHHGLFDFGKWGQDHHDHHDHGGWWDHHGDRGHGGWWNREEHNWWNRDHHHHHDNWWNRDDHHRHGDHHGGWWDREDDHGPDHGGWGEREAENIGWWNRDRVHDEDVLPYTGPPADLWGKVATAGGLVIMGGVFWWLARIWPRRTFPVTPR
ncbi:hypothetical protein FDA94_06655 [Herbidospora galbida]|uniref:Uncharacterized protein n=1 Tax=Herbidospora galbida TaxID=2575442 RepID=A0A4U3MPA2_9ACTN|nr:hypothetical protein [Herbidospora galbida]TKK90097.1 hypothetical protein FDA94_06655 [Herbidospora galbida]